jgi:hypothetical protein
MSGLQERRVSAVLRDDARNHNYFVSLDLLIRDGREVVREALPLLSGAEVPDSNYELHYNWLDESRDRSIRVVGGRLEPQKTACKDAKEPEPLSQHKAVAAKAT